MTGLMKIKVTFKLLRGDYFHLEAVLLEKRSSRFNITGLMTIKITFKLLRVEYFHLEAILLE